MVPASRPGRSNLKRAFVYIRRSDTCSTDPNGARTCLCTSLVNTNVIRDVPDITCFRPANPSHYDRHARSAAEKQIRARRNAKYAAKSLMGTAVVLRLAAIASNKSSTRVTPRRWRHSRSISSTRGANREFVSLSSHCSIVVSLSFFLSLSS